MGIDIWPIVEVKKNGAWQRVIDTPDCLENRNYSVFGLLANVSNYDNVIPIQECRGLPDKKTKTESDHEGWGEGYLTLEELNNYNWEGYHSDRDGVVEKVKDS